MSASAQPTPAGALAPPSTDEQRPGAGYGIDLQLYGFRLSYGHAAGAALREGVRIRQANPASVNLALSGSLDVLVGGPLVIRVGGFLSPKGDDEQMALHLATAELGVCARRQRPGRWRLSACVDAGAGYLSLANPTATQSGSDGIQRPMNTRTAGFAVTLRPSLVAHMPLHGGGALIFSASYLRSMTCLQTLEFEPTQDANLWCPAGFGLGVGVGI